MGLRDLLYVGEHTPCRHYVSDYSCGFVYRELREGAKLDIFDKHYNYLVFILKGSVDVGYRKYTGRNFKSWDIVFMAKHAGIDFKMKETGAVLVARFDVPINVCDKLTFKSYWQYCQKIEYDFQPSLITPQMKYFIDGMVYYLKNGISCEHFYEIKQSEMFLIFRWFYQKEELAKLFYPIIGKRMDFRAVVLENYMNVGSVGELANIACMSRSKFDTVFKEEFGMPPGEWMLRQKANHIRYYLSDPDATISDAIVKFGFNSSTHFTRFCKQYLGSPPKEYMAKLRQV